MKFQNLTFSNPLFQLSDSEKNSDFQIGRITIEHKERYIILSQQGEFEGEITGNLRFSAKGREDFPAVGDWVVFQVFDKDMAIIHRIFPRKTTLERLAVNKHAEKQIIATNIDVAFVVQSADHDFNINRLERYLTICYNAKIEPVLVLSKIDLITDNELDTIKELLKSRKIKLSPIFLSNFSKNDIEKIGNIIKDGKTYCFIGSSGVGKSTLINNLTGVEKFETQTISQSTGKGRHTTSHRELIVLESGGILIDTPGMREIGMTDVVAGIATTFETILELAENCRFADCTHTNEKGCAVIQAVEDELISRSSFENFHKMQHEQQRFSATIAEKRKKEREFGKMVKSIMKEKKKSKGSL